MEIINKKITELKPYEKNPRKNDEAVKYVAESIKQFGFKVPIIIDKNNTIVCGHTRYKASKKLGLSEVPCILADDLTDEQIKAFRLADNKVSERSEWDFDLLNDELKEIVDIDMKDFDFDMDDKEKEAEEDDYVVEPPEDPKSKYGDIYQLGEHRLMCGDSTKEEDIKQLMDGAKIKCLFTSPPYNINSKMYNKYEDNLKSQDYIDFNLKVVKAYKKYLKGYLFWNISYNKNSRWEFIEILYKIVKETGLKFMELIVWDKGHTFPFSHKNMLRRTYEDILMVGDEESISEDMELYYLGNTEEKGYFNKIKGRGVTNYWKIDSNGSQLDNHKACFPVKLPGKAIQLTTNEGDIVADCFGGSGTTLIAAEQLNRKCYMMEFDPVYIDVIIDRWEQFTGKKAVLLNRR